MMRHGLFILAAALIFGASAAKAQPTGSRIDNSRLVEDPVAGWRYGRCAAGFRAEQSEAFLATASGSREAAAAIRRVTNRNDDRCYTEAEISGQTLYMQEPLLRGAISQGRYLRAYPDAPPLAISEAAASQISVEVYNQRISSAGDTRAEIVAIFGDCVTAADPSGVDRLIRTDVQSAAEGRAIQSLADHFGPCLWEGQSIAFSAESLRASLAAALYRKAQGRTVIAVANRTEAEE